ncbi:MAG: hypothetical protein JHC13_00880 [Acidilobus sp.]|nr:hypothetical protein [Acidilobus sp.]
MSQGPEASEGPRVVNLTDRDFEEFLRSHRAVVDFWAPGAPLLSDLPYN